MTCFHLHEGPRGVELIEEVAWQEPGAWGGENQEGVFHGDMVLGR